jgi:hypothetical protein
MKMPIGFEGLAWLTARVRHDLRGRLEAARGDPGAGLLSGYLVAERVTCFQGNL